MDITNSYRTFHTNTKEYAFISAPHGTFSKIDHILRHKERLIIYKKSEVSPYILSDPH